MSINSIEKPHILFKNFNLKDYSNICKKPIESIKVCYLGTDFAFLNHFNNLNVDSIDISKELSVFADRIKYDFIDYIASIGQQKNNHVYWWATKLASKSNLQSDLFSIVCLLLVGKQLTDSKRCDLFVVNDYRIYFLIKNNFNFKSSFFSLTKAYGSRFNKLVLNISKLFASRLFWFLRTMIKNINDPKYLKKIIIKSNFIYSWVEKRSFDENGKYNDPYLPGIEKFGLINPSVLFIPYYIKSNLYPKLKSSHHVITGLSCYSSTSKLLTSLLAFITIRYDSFFKGINFRLLLFDEIIKENCSSHLCSQIHDYKCWKGFFKQSKGKLIYPYENQPWEKMMILARDHVHGSIKLIGHQHSAVGKIHLSYHTTDNELRTLPVPDVLIVNSDKNEELMKKYYENKCKTLIFNGGALRYAQTKLFEKSNNKRKSLGILLPINKNHAYHLLGKINKISSFQFNVLVKPHPDLALDKSDIGKACNLFKGSAMDLYKEVDGVIYCSSTCGMEAYQYGLPVFRFSGQFIDLMIGEDSLSPKVICSLDEISVSDLVPHKPVQLFSTINDNLWKDVLN